MEISPIIGELAILSTQIFTCTLISVSATDETNILARNLELSEIPCWGFCCVQNIQNYSLTTAEEESVGIETRTATLMVLLFQLCPHIFFLRLQKKLRANPQGQINCASVFCAIFCLFLLWCERKLKSRHVLFAERSLFFLITWELGNYLLFYFLNCLWDSIKWKPNHKISWSLYSFQSSHSLFATRPWSYWSYFNMSCTCEHHLVFNINQQW